MRYDIRHIILLLSSLLTAWTASAAGPSPASRGVVVLSETAHSRVDEKLLRNQVDFLSDSICSGRGTGERGAVEAAMWIERGFRSRSIMPFGESYSRSFVCQNGQAGRDIMGMFHACGDRWSGKYVVVMAHYDGLGQIDGQMYPGADDNASGVAAMLGVASMFRTMTGYGRSYRQDIIFVATDAKNLNMAGAKELWRLIESGSLTDPLRGRSIRKEDISLVVNIDQIGSVLSPLRKGQENYMIMLSGDSDGDLKMALQLSERRYGLGIDLGFSYYGSSVFTDMFYRRVSEQKIFIENKIPSVMFTSGITMNNNKVWDTVETLDMAALKKRIWLIFHWMERVM